MGIREEKEKGHNHGGGGDVSTGDGETSPLFIRFLYHFNGDRDYFECHEVLEELWLEEGRHPLYQGLLQVAVALFHCRNGNLNGARKLFRQALDKLQHYPEKSLGIDLGMLRRESEAYLAELERAGDGPFLFYDLDIQVVDPELRKRLAEWKNHTPR